MDRKARRATLGSVYAGGKWSLTLGWGVQFADFSVSPATPYPYAPDVLLSTRDRVRDQRCSPPSAAPSSGRDSGSAPRASTRPIACRCRRACIDAPATPPISHGVFVADIGVARNIVGGVGARFRSEPRRHRRTATDRHHGAETGAAGLVDVEAGRPARLGAVHAADAPRRLDGAGGGRRSRLQLDRGLLRRAARGRPAARVRSRAPVHLRRGVDGRSADD